MFVRDPDQRFRIGLGAGGNFRLDESDNPRVRIGLERVLQFLRIDRASPVVLDHQRGTAAALHVLLHAAAEHAVLAHDDLVAGLDQIGKTGFHAGGTGCGNGHGQFVPGLERVFQQYLHFIHHPDEHRVQMANGRACHGSQNARADVGRAGAHQDALGRMKRFYFHVALSVLFKLYRNLSCETFK